MRNLWWIPFILGCTSILNPPIEQRVFFPSEVSCRTGIGPNAKSTLYVEGLGPLPDTFMIVGLGRYTQDQMLLDLCEERGLIRKRKKGNP